MGKSDGIIHDKKISLSSLARSVASALSGGFFFRSDSNKWFSDFYDVAT
jgi:hypothetical protein